MESRRLEEALSQSAWACRIQNSLSQTVQWEEHRVASPLAPNEIAPRPHEEDEALFRTPTRLVEATDVLPSALHPRHTASFATPTSVFVMPQHSERTIGSLARTAQRRLGRVSDEGDT